MKIPSITYSHFDRIGEFYTSLAAVIIGNLIFIGYRFFEVYTLFDKYLTLAQMDPAGVFIASKLIAVVVIFTMLLISVNSDRFRYPRIAEALGFSITLFINLYFWDIWNAIATDEIIFKIGISLVTAAFDVAFAYLFVEKWRERNHAADLKRRISESERSLSDYQRQLSKTELKLTTTERKITERERLLKETTCPKCGRDDFKSKNAVNAHFHHCK
jgi:hypothetical protein